MTASVVPFQPVGDKSRKRLLIELVDACLYDQLLSFEELEDFLGCGRKEVYATVSASAMSMEAELSKTLISERGKGYRVARPDEHWGEAHKRQRRARRQTLRAKSKVDHVDENGLTQEERNKLANGRQVLAALAAFEKRADMKYASKASLDAWVAEQSSRNERTAGELDAIRSRMERLEAKLGRVES